MPIIFLKEDKENTLEMEPYRTLGKKLDDKIDDGLDGCRIKVNIGNHKDGFVNGFEISRYYAEDIVLMFSFTRNPNSLDDNECYLVHHQIEFEFDSDFADVQRDSLEEIDKRSKYFYIDGASYYEFSYLIGIRKVEMRFDVLTAELNIRKVCNQLISHDIAIFSRGW
jgi:hypothetical protein